MATKVDQDESFDNCLWSNRVMEFGKHRISLKLIQGEGIGLAHLFGLVCDGAEWNKFHGEKESTDAWYMVNYEGYLYGNGKLDDDRAGHIKHGSRLAQRRAPILGRWQAARSWL